MTLREAFESRMMLLDGGMGSVIQTYGIKGANNDMLSIERPDVILDIQRRYVDAGVDVLTTNTFSSQRVSQHEYHQEHRIAEMNRASVKIAKQAAAEAMEKYGRKVYIAGDVGPTSKMLSMSDDVNDPANRAITFDELEDAYLEQIQVLVEEDVDAILIETIFDTLNAKAAASACMKVFDKRKADAAARGEDPAALKPIEIMFSMTVSDASGRTLSGQTVEAFAISVMHAKPLSIGLNCGLGADGMIPYLRRMGKLAPCYISCHPNAGLPNQFGGYDDTPEDMVRLMQPYMDEHLVNMVGGCCGTTPEHIAAMRKMLDALPSDYERRKPAPAFVTSPLLRLAGLEPLMVNQVRPSNGADNCNAEDFVMVGERCNVAGSKKFLRLINEKNYEEALDIARKQVEDGAQVVDVNMDDGLLDAKQEMRTFLNLLASDPAISRVPIMVDSSRFEVIEEGLKCAQGKCIVNSISLKMGEEAFIEHAMTVKRLGAAVIVMLFDEEGQATNYDRRVSIASRAYKLITEKCGFDPSDIIFDPNVLTVATGMAEHNAYAHDFIRACRWIIDNLPGVRISGGLSNLSFAFRGNNYLREAMHSTMLHLATPNGMGMAIMNPAAAVEYKSIPMELRMAITEVLLNTHPESSEELIEIASRMNEAAAKAKETGAKYDPKAIFALSAGAGAVSAGDSGNTAVAVQTTPEQRLQEALLKGTSTTLQPDLMELINRGDSPVSIISGPLMDGMNEVGRLFGEGKMFLPQVVKTARTMKKAVEILQPYIEAGKEEGAASRGKIVIATVKGDVHDIGKNIVSVIMACNGFEMVDLGVMVPEDVIVNAAIEHKADIVSLSGLITPSLEEMCTVAIKMQEAGLRIPIIVGGATTSPTHTAVKIAPCYDGPVFHVRDAASNPGLAQKLLDPATREATIEENRKEQQRIRDEQSGKVAAKAEAMAAAEKTPVERRFACDWSKYSPVQPPFFGESKLPPISLDRVIPLISWEYFFYTWKVKADCEEAQKLRADAETLLDTLNKPEYSLRAVQAFYPAAGTETAVLFNTGRTGTAEDIVEINTARQQNPEGTCLALCDYVAPADAKTDSVYASMVGDRAFRDIVGAFAVTVSDAFVKRLEKLKAEQGGSDYDVLLMQTVADRLAEAGAEYLSRELDKNCNWKGIRPAVGYPVLPNIKEIFNVAKLIDFDSVGISLTENGAMYPQASVSGLYISHPEIEYFNVKVN
ncbi:MULTISPECIES: homocysteine S-methyltransferase family protein [unclassified Fibrobacter]|uniref:homocysteine S-methyltransferase family protein n=1 Tax=unclassified Fibrobacter TaxID=2634177 RepID=UPI000D6B8D36|nr:MULTISPECIES: homocysteine S-methyltransferase family protein [unclassified Fibrobacter]PWJ71914.1 methionine synthase (B12-dependent) [Fibrobacter sp. UWR4]PZW70364.1 methionine synthase (B12-dependent) [Fibrobacter sp. UWR1]